MKRFSGIRLVSLIGLIVVALTVTGFAADTVKTGGVVRIIGQWGNLPQNFNPFLASGQYTPGTQSALFEQLFHVNSLNGEITPVLGTSYEWQNDNLKLVIKTREGVKWSDGVPFSAKDVAFTFNYMKEYPALDLSGIWSNGLIKVEAIDDTTVELTFEKQNTPLFQYIANALIAPEHIWSKIEEPSLETNLNPVVTGPFTVKAFTPEAVTYEKNPNYWMDGRPYIDEVVYRAVKSNDTTILLLLRKQADYSHLYIPDPEKAYVAEDPKNNRYWWPVTNTNMLYLNTTKAPFSDIAFRKAMAYAIDTQAMSEKAYYSVIDAAHPTNIVPAQLDDWFDQSLSDMLFSYEKEKAKAILSEAGYSWNSNGALLDPAGEKIPALRILVGAGWTDFISMAQIISQNMKELGVEMVIQQEPWNSYINSLMGGTFDTGICWGGGTGPTPYDIYYRTLGSEFAGSETEQAPSNYSRYRNSVVDEALATYRASSDLEVQKAAIAKIQEVVLRDIPYIPLTNRTNFNVYQTSRFVGWPTEEDPYNGGDPGDTLGGRLMLLNIHLK